MTSSTSTPEPEQEQQQISAYYSLIFPNFTFYLQTTTCTIGRKTAVGSSSGASRVDVDLGQLKSVSRLHARIEYDSDLERFVLVVIGRNGAWVDGVWASAGSRVPLGDYSQIQIASRTFQFALPPAPPQPQEDDARSLSRSRSPSLIDITSELPRSISPPIPSSPPRPKPSQVPKPHGSPKHSLPNSNSIKPKQNPNSKRHSKVDQEERPRPEDMPPKPSLTYAQLIYRALKGIGGKATLQEICAWISDTYDYYKWADAQWMSSVRHNLSSGRAFKKLERCGGDRGKGFFWIIDEEQDCTALEGEAKGSEAKAKKDKKGDLKRNGMKPDANGTYSSLPPPLTTRPLEFKVAVPKSVTNGRPDSIAPPMASLQPPANVATVVPYSTSATSNIVLGAVKSEYSSTPLSAPNPYAPRQANGTSTTNGWHYTPPVPIQPHQAQASLSKPPHPSPSTPTTPHGQTLTQLSTSMTFLDKDARVPIVVGPPPPSYKLPPQPPTSSPTSATSSTTESAPAIPPMLLHESTIYLTPEVFSTLDRKALDAIEALGVQQALEILRGHMSRFLKQKMGKRGRTMKKKPKVNGTVTGALATNAPPLQSPTATNVETEERKDEEEEIVVVDDSEDERPVAKKRKVEVV